MTSSPKCAPRALLHFARDADETRNRLVVANTHIHTQNAFCPNKINADRPSFLAIMYKTNTISCRRVKNEVLANGPFKIHKKKKNVINVLCVKTLLFEIMNGLKRAFYSQKYARVGALNFHSKLE